MQCLFLFCTFFLRFIGRIFGGVQVRIKIRETTGEGIHREVVHASRDPLKGEVELERGKVREGSESEGRETAIDIVVCGNHDWGEL